MTWAATNASRCLLGDYTKPSDIGIIIRYNKPLQGDPSDEPISIMQCHSDFCCCCSLILTKYLAITSVSPCKKKTSEFTSPHPIWSISGSSGVALDQSTWLGVPNSFWVMAFGRENPSDLCKSMSLGFVNWRSLLRQWFFSCLYGKDTTGNSLWNPRLILRNKEMFDRWFFSD